MRKGLSVADGHRLQSTTARSRAGRQRPLALLGFLLLLASVPLAVVLPEVGVPARDADDPGLALHPLPVAQDPRHGLVASWRRATYG